MNSIKRLPDGRCVICRRSIAEVGGSRIVSQRLRGIDLAEKYLAGGNGDFPYQSFRMPGTSLYLVVWGELAMWDAGAVARGLAALQRGRRPWFCQLCGHRACHVCGAPINFAVASEVLSDDGSISHCAIVPADMGCINPRCEKYRDLGLV